MKATFFLILCVLGLSFSGCATSTPEIVKEQIYIKQTIPQLPEKKPIEPIQIFYVDINGETFIAMKPSQGILLINNWNSYKTWAEENRVILNNLK